MSELKAKPGNLVMAEAMPFGQHHTYHDVYPVEMMLDQRFFASLRSNLRAGDLIRLVSVRDDRVIEEIDAVVVQILANGVDLRPRCDLIFFPDQVEEEEKPKNKLDVHGELTVKRGYHEFLVLNETGKQLAAFPKKADAVAFIQERKAA